MKGDFYRGNGKLAALDHLPPHLMDRNSYRDLPTDSEYMKVLGIE